MDRVEGVDPAAKVCSVAEEVVAVDAAHRGAGVMAVTATVGVVVDEVMDMDTRAMVDRADRAGTRAAVASKGAVDREVIEATGEGRDECPGRAPHRQDSGRRQGGI